MSTDSFNESKFGLPKPDFQNLPSKKPIWPFITIIVLVALSAAGKVVYSMHFKSVNKQSNEAPLPEALQETPTKDQQSASSEVYGASTEGFRFDNHGKTDTAIDTEVNEAVSGSEAFEHKNNTKKTENIAAVQKRLEEHKNNPRPLVKPGTYQELPGPQGIYHLVVVSHLDKRSALNTIHKLMKKDLGVCLILPRKGEKYYRVTIGHSRTQYEAEQKLTQLKLIYKNLFILKY
ncbi:hypothetical protein [Cardinium endosymbiont of Tipula unca]|uniref:hypothetical protein n=1 Tax=Cardinium endosymbiont of Tipula unca TaxID=3066216 RepID=UPI0030D12A47